MDELEQQAIDWVGGKRADELQQDIFGRQYLWNVFSHNSPIDMDTLYNEEETKAMRETAKIFGDESFRNKVQSVPVQDSQSTHHLCPKIRYGPPPSTLKNHKL